MKSLLEESTREELISRIQSLKNDSPRQWGAMNVFQMMRHCTLWDDMVLNNRTYKRVWVGRLFGKIMLKNELKDSSPMRKNNPTIPELTIKETQGDFQAEKDKWISLIQAYQAYKLPDNSFMHPFFGRMTREQIGWHAYKHADHHLRQFGC